MLGLDGKTKLNPKSATLARSINASDNYKTVHTIQTDDKGLEEQFGDCSTLYFYDKRRVIAFSSCQMGTDFETGLEEYSKAA